MMSSLPFAELKFPRASGQSDDDVLANNLDEFPPLHLTSHPIAPLTRSPQISAYHGIQDWELICGLSFSPKQPASEDGEGDWENIHYSTTIPQKSFAEIAESGSMNDPLIPLDQFFRWSSHRRHRHHQNQRSIDDGFVNSVDDETSFEDIFDHAKSRSRTKALRIPFVRQRKQRLCDVVFRREVRSLTSIQVKHFDSLTKAAQDLCDTQLQLLQNEAKWSTLSALSNRKDASIRRPLMLDLVVQELRERGILHISSRKRSRPWDHHQLAILHVAKCGFRNTDKWTAFYQFLFALFWAEKERLMNQEKMLLELLNQDESNDVDPLKAIFKKMSKRGLMPCDRSLRRERRNDLIGRLNDDE
ncbi:hypothetical protein BX666DRAFT_1480023 [Dichotomocladium elegans]|nr:hypothetical protein BX666DRAFT_1480023 [Dichotomocladium elegans]